MRLIAEDAQSLADNAPDPNTCQVYICTYMYCVEKAKGGRQSTCNRRALRLGCCRALLEQDPTALKVELVLTMKPDIHYPKTGINLRRLRVNAGITQENLARAVGVTTHTIWRLENDPAANPRLKTLRALARALRVTMSQLLDD